MKNTNITKSNPLAHKVKINLDVLGPLMLNMVGGHVDHTDVVTVDQRRAGKRSMKLDEKLAQPSCLNHCIGNGAILSFSSALDRETVF